VRLENAKEEKAQAEQQVRELQEDLASLQAQNSLFSEWMLVRNENAIAAQREDPPDQDQAYPPHHPQMKTRAASPTTKRKSAWHVQHEYDADCSSDSSFMYRRDTSPRIRPMPSSSRGHQAASPPKSVRSEHDDEPQYAMPKTSYSSRPSTPGSPSSARPQASRRWQSTAPSSPQRAARHHNIERAHPPSRSPRRSLDRKMSTTSLSSMCSSATSAAAASSSSSARDDHERLRKLMSRNRELQQRLQQETMATQNLEREITSMTS
jgi:hypothetical protein